MGPNPSNPCFRNSVLRHPDFGSATDTTPDRDAAGSRTARLTRARLERLGSQILQPTVSQRRLAEAREAASNTRWFCKPSWKSGRIGSPEASAWSQS